MLYAAPSVPVEQKGLSVLFPHYPRVVIAALARLTRAYDPYGPLPPNIDILSTLVSPNVDMEVITKLNSTLAAVGMSGGKPEDRLKEISDPVFKALMNLANYFAIGAKVKPAHGYIFRDRTDTTAKQDQGAQAGSVVKRLDSLCELDQGYDTGEGADDEGYLSGKEAGVIAFLTLLASFPRILESFLTKPEDVPMGAPRDIYPVVVRMQKLLTTVVVLRHSLTLSGLRERAAFLLSAPVVPLHPYIGTVIREELLHGAQRVLGLKVHPWLAEAERMTKVIARQTAWGKSTASMGLASSPSERGLWNRILQWHSARGGSLDMRAMLLDPSKEGFLNKMHSDLKQLFELRDVLDKDFVAGAEAMLPLASTGTAPMVHLFGDDWRAITASGAMASESLNDLLVLMTRPRFPLRDASGNAGQLEGTALTFEYDAAKWMTNTTKSRYHLQVLTQGKVIPPLFITPHRADLTDGYGLGIIIPEQLRPKIDTEYFGDEDAAFADYSPAGIAEALGLGGEEDLRANGELVERLKHLLTYDGSLKRWNKVHPSADKVFHSTRTREFWRRPVQLPSALPDATLAFSDRTAPTVGQVSATLFRDPLQQVLTASSLDGADALAQHAAAGLGLTTLGTSITAK